MKNKLLSLRDDRYYPFVVFPNSFSSLFNTSFSTNDLLEYCRKTKGDLPCLMPFTEPVKPEEPSLKDIPTSYWGDVKLNFWKTNDGRFLLCCMAIVIPFGIIPLFTFSGGVGSTPLDKICDAFVWMLGVTILLSPILFLLYVFRHILGGEWDRTVCRPIPYSEEELIMMREEEQERYLKALQEYPKQLKKYEEEMQKIKDYDRKRDEIMLECMMPYISSLLKSYYVKSVDFNLIDEAPKKGRSEDLLFATLMHSIPDSVHIDTIISGYYPDLMVSTHNGVFMDIEIDEPYDMDSKKEIHYIGCEDDNRNERIAKREWLVMRFSEKQVMTDCASCTRIIKAMMEFIENGSMRALNEIVSLKNEIKDSRWRKEDARMMAIENYRKTY